MDVDPRSGYRPILDALIRLYPDYMAQGSHTIRDGYRKVAHLAHGWYLRCYRGAEALVLLDRHGYAEEASPIRRSMIEHTVSLKWLAAEGDKIADTVASGHVRSGTRRRDAVAAARWTSIDLDEFDEAIASAQASAVNRENDYLLQFAKSNGTYGDPHNLIVWLAECARSHPSYESARCYIDGSPDGSSWSPRPSSYVEIPQAPFATTYLLEATIAVVEVFDPHPWETELGDLVRRYQQVTDEVRAHDGLAAVDWETGTLKAETNETSSESS